MEILIGILSYKHIILVALYIIITIINVIDFARSSKALFMFDNPNVFMSYVLYIIILALLLIATNQTNLFIIPVMLTGIVLCKIGRTIYDQYTTNA